MKTNEVLKEVLSGKRLSADSRRCYGQAFRSLALMYEEFPTKAVEVNKWLASLDAYGDYTVRTWFSNLRSASEYMEANYQMVNPFKGLKLPSVKKKRRRYHTAEELMLILQACRGDIDYALIMALIDSSCRIGALEELKGRDVGEGWFNADEEKTGERRYRLDERIGAKLKELAGGDDNYVFGAGRHSLSMRVIRISRRAGLKGDKLGAHTLRHSSASLVAGKTGSALAVKALLQHDDIRSSMGYVHDVEEGIQKAISPLKLVAEAVNGSGMFGQKQIPLKTGEGAVEGEVVGEEGLDDYIIADMFPAIPEGTEVRSVLRFGDLMLIREAFIGMAVSGRFARQVGEARLLMKRMLRKVK